MPQSRTIWGTRTNTCAGELTCLLPAPPGFRAQPDATHSACEILHDPPNRRPPPLAGILYHIFCTLLRSLCIRALTAPGTETEPSPPVKGTVPGKPAKVSGTCLGKVTQGARSRGRPLQEGSVRAEKCGEPPGTMWKAL